MTFLTWPHQSEWLANLWGTTSPMSLTGLSLGLMPGLILSLLLGLWISWHRRSTRHQSKRQLAVWLTAAYQHHPEAIFVTDLDHRLFYLNDAAEQLSGWSREAAEGQRLATVLPLSSRDGAPVDAFSAAMRNPTPGPAFPPLTRPATDVFAELSVALPLLKIPGRPDQSLAITLTPLRSDAGRQGEEAPDLRPWIGMMLTVSDGVTQRRTSERDAMTLHVAQATADAIIGMTRTFKIASWNAGAARMFSYQNTDVLGEPLAMLVPADRLAALEQAVRAAFAGELLHDRDLVIRTRDGHECDVSLAAFPLAASAHSPVEMALVLRNITDRRQGERRVRHLSGQLVRRAQELQAIFDIAPVGMAIADTPDCRHVRPNRALAALLGLERATDIRLDGGSTEADYTIWHNGRRMPAAASPLLAAVAQRAAIEPIELEIRVADRVSTVMAYGAPVIDQDDAVVGAIGVFVDISVMKHAHAERQRLLAEAIAAQRVAEKAIRLKEEFLATVSHELRTPLNAMHGWLEIMQRKPDAQTQARGMDVIRRNVKAQTRVIEDILDVSAFVTGKARLIVRPIDLVDVSRATVESLLPTAEAKAVQLHLIDVIHTPVIGDPERLQQVIWNLLSNAIKFTPSGGTVSLRLRREGEHAMDDPPVGTAIIEVSDNGEGIDAAFLPYVFDRFRQADASIERRHAGLGLGLSIVRHLTELHGGSVEVDSAGLGLGATFRIRLPLRPATDSSATTVMPDDFEGFQDGARRVDDGRVFGTLLGKQILIVEDDVSAADMLAHALIDDGAQVRVSHSAEAGLQLMEEAPADVIVSDIGMPQRDGYSFVADIRAADERSGRPPVVCIAVTAYARPEDRERALSAGFDAYLVKPVTPSVLSKAIADRLAIASTSTTAAGSDHVHGEA